MRELNLRQAVFGAALLLSACGSSNLQSGTPGNGRSGQAGSGGGGQGGSSGDGGASCVAVSACGGDLVGTWRVTQSCVAGTESLGVVCPGATGEIEFAIGGTITFNADGSYSSIPTGGTATIHDHFPPGCMPFGQTCAELGQTLVDGGTITSATCSTDSAGACNCEVTAPEMITNENGTYATSGGTVTFTHDGMTSTAQYCVQGGTLYETAEQGDGGLVSMGSIVYARQ